MQGETLSILRSKLETRPANGFVCLVAEHPDGGGQLLGAVEVSLQSEQARPQSIAHRVAGSSWAHVLRCSCSMSMRACCLSGLWPCQPQGRAVTPHWPLSLSCGQLSVRTMMPGTHACLLCRRSCWRCRRRA